MTPLEWDFQRFLRPKPHERVINAPVAFHSLLVVILGVPFTLSVTITRSSGAVDAATLWEWCDVTKAPL